LVNRLGFRAMRLTGEGIWGFAFGEGESLKIATSLGLSLLRNRGLAAKDILLDLAGGCFRRLGLSRR